MSEFLWPYTENAAPLRLFDAAQLDDAELERRRDSRVYNLLQEQAARADKIREENKQIAAEQADLKNSDKHKGRRCKARSPDREKGPRICPSCGEHTWEQMPLGTCDTCALRAALKKSFPTRRESGEATKDDDDDAEIPAAPKTRKAAWEILRKAPRKAKAVKEEDQFYAQFVAAGSHGQPPLVSSWAPQQTEASSSWQAPQASSSWQAPPPPPPPRPPSSSRQAPPPPPPTWSRST